jgi:hypothetical protein
LDSMIPKGLKCVPMYDECYPMEVVFLLQHLKHPGDLGVTMGVTIGGVVIPLSAVRPCGKGVPPRRPWTCMEVCT